MDLGSKIYVAGHRGMVGSAIVRGLWEKGYSNLIIQEVDLTNQSEVNKFFETEKPEYVFLVAGKVGGIKANNEQRAEFIYKNLMIQSNVIHAAYLNGVTKLLFTGSSCIYPKNISGVIKESDLLKGELEPTNEPYAVAKIAGIKMCQAYNFQYGCNFISAMPTNSYGPNDKYDLNDSHVIPALLKKFIHAQREGSKEVEIWGSGSAKREFIYVDDLADALIFLMNNYDSPELINVGSGEEYTIKRVAELIKYILKYDCELKFTGELDGMHRKLIDSSKLSSIGWTANTTLNGGLIKTIKHLKEIGKYDNL